MTNNTLIKLFPNVSSTLRVMINPLTAINNSLMNNNTSTINCESYQISSTGIWTILCGVIIVLAGIISNCLVIYLSMSKNNKHRWKSTSFILSLAVNDLLCFPLLISIIVFIYKPCERTDLFHILNTSFHIFLHFNSQFHTMTISMERAFAVWCPFQHKVGFTLKYSIITIAGLWLCSALLFVVFLVQIKYEYSNPTVLLWSLVTLGFPIPVGVVIISYCSIGIKSYHRIQKRKDDTGGKRQHGLRSRLVSNEMKNLLNISLLVLPMTASWSVFFIVIIYEEVSGSYIDGWLLYVMTFLPFVSSAVDPILFIVGTRSLRERLRISTFRFRLKKTFSNDTETIALTKVSNSKTMLSWDLKSFQMNI